MEPERFRAYGLESVRRVTGEKRSKAGPVRPRDAASPKTNDSHVQQYF